ncbi:MAG: NADH-quinone oxidoreductase subunit E [Pseudomonadota bacterium]
MSVRRLADDHLQPEGFAFSAENASWAEDKIKDYPEGREASAVIPLLMRAQDQDGWVTKAAIEHIAKMLNMPLIRVLEVATFYTQFQLKPVGTKAHIQVCGTTPCLLRGSEDLMAVCRKKINQAQFETNDAGTLSWEEVECLGACVNAPMIMVFKDTYEDLTPERLEEIIDQFEAGKGDEIPVGPQIDRIRSAPEGGLTCLTGSPEVKPASGKSRSSRTKKAATISTPAKKPSAASKTDSSTVALAKTAKESGARKAPAKKTASKKEDVNPTLSIAESAKGTEKPKASKGAKADATKKQAKKPAPAAATDVSADDKNRPPQIEKPDQPDDLKLISGVGPKLEGVLNGLGIYTFEQISKWKKAEREWVDGYLKFKGRIDRDDWVKQAKALAKGGVDEYLRVFGKKPR